jgi:hypothetical protein
MIHYKPSWVQNESVLKRKVISPTLSPKYAIPDSRSSEVNWNRKQVNSIPGYLPRSDEIHEKVERDYRDLRHRVLGLKGLDRRSDVPVSLLQLPNDDSPREKALIHAQRRNRDLVTLAMRKPRDAAETRDISSTRPV